jgi:hypothetical protein
VRRARNPGEYKVKLSKALIAELYVNEVENLADRVLLGGRKEMSEAVEAVRGQSSATLKLSRGGALELYQALDNMEDVNNDYAGLYPETRYYRALARAAAKKRDEIRTMLTAKPTASNPGPSGSLLGIGHLTALEVLDPKTGRTKTVKPKGKLWLGWLTDQRTYRICNVVRTGQTKFSREHLVGTGLSPKVAKAHRRFHQAAPRSAITVDAPNPSGKMKQLGLLKALTYSVPGQVKSPDKNRYLWRHAFGDTGHKGGSAYPTKVMPALMQDAKGNLFIKRRPGNIFTVDSWLRG